ALAFAHDGSLIAGDAEGRLTACDSASPSRGDRGHRGPITCLAISPDGSLCASGGEDASIILWDRHTLQVPAPSTRPLNRIDAILFTPDGKTIASVADRLQLWDVASGQPTISLIDGLEHLDPPGRVAITSDGSALFAIVARQNDYRVMSWRAARAATQ